MSHETPSFLVEQDGEAASRADFQPDDTFLAALFRAGFFTRRSLCAGLGRCGRCRILFKSPPPPAAPGDRKALGELVEQGYRLACLHPARPDARVEVPRTPDPAPAPPRPKAAAPGVATGLAVDLGTTSLAYALVAQGRVLFAAEGPNPQLGAGREVLSRVGFALRGGAVRLREAVTSELAAVAAAQDAPPTRMCLAANPAMTALALGLPVDGLAASPYRLPTRGDLTTDLGPGLPPCYVPPQLSPFVGGDAVAAHTHIVLSRKPAAPWLVADLGTNGEFVLDLSSDRALAASIPMGPALEGVGVAGSVPACPGAVSSFVLGPAGLRPKRLPEADGSPSSSRPGPCGAGFVSLCALLVRHKVLDDRGLPTPEAPALARRLGLAFTVDEDGFAVHIEDVRVGAADVEELLSLKAAFDLALSRLLEQASLRPGELSAVYLAGALGRYLALPDLETLGFLPPGLSRRCQAVGNAALAGAMDLLDEGPARDCARSLAKRCRAVDLTAANATGARDESGTGDFVGRMRFAFIGPARSII